LIAVPRLEEARSSVSPFQNNTSFNRSPDFGVKKNAIFQFPDEQYRVGSFQTRLAAWVPTLGY
jgi:hypothetical protein